MISRFSQFSATISSISRCLQRIERVEMAKYGLKGPHAQCLVAIAQYPDGITAAKLCQICEKDKAAISRILSELENAGMVQRTPLMGSRCRATLSLTKSGRKVADGVNDLVSMAVVQASAGYGEEEQHIFAQVLSLVCQNLQGICRDGLPAAAEE